MKRGKIVNGYSFNNNHRQEEESTMKNPPNPFVIEDAHSSIVLAADSVVACARKGTNVPLEKATAVFDQHICSQGHKACKYHKACRQVGRDLADKEKSKK